MIDRFSRVSENTTSSSSNPTLRPADVPRDPVQRVPRAGERVDDDRAADAGCHRSAATSRPIRSAKRSRVHQPSFAPATVRLAHTSPRALARRSRGSPRRRTSRDHNARPLASRAPRCASRRAATSGRNVGLRLGCLACHRDELSRAHKTGTVRFPGVSDIGDSRFHKGQPIWVMGRRLAARGRVRRRGRVSAWFGGAPTVFVVYAERGRARPSRSIA